MVLPRQLERIVNQYAPIFLADRFKHASQDACNANIPTSVNFDGDWDPTNNEASYEKDISEHKDLLANPSKYKFANVYYEAIASKTHVYITYYLFYPHDAGDNCAFAFRQPGGGHQNDASSMMLIVRKGATYLDHELEYVVMSDHDEVAKLLPYQVKRLDGKPVISVSSGNHTMEAVKSRASLPDRKDNYYFGGGKGEKYKLTRIFDTLWRQRKNSKLFCRAFRDIGAQYCAKEGDTKRGTPPWAPWVRTFTEGGKLFCGLEGMCLSFYDPIKAFQQLYPEESGYSLEYEVNPYLNNDGAPTIPFL